MCGHSFFNIRKNEFVQNILQSQGDEHRELLNLNNRTQLLWKDIDRRIQKYSEELLEHNEHWINYEERVTEPLIKLTELNDEYHNPKQYKANNFITKFERLCSNPSR
ncbi:hypothetical protein B9Z55_025743 [Caenorhabditis nigoni]|uniref:Uncharacterized protein n=1 Tax=Caenorhabditis nigoni TaxID=1611254 RepID=A0A2G5T053_9PELO|nr:hypothetical protein B9Z55_025743 [Caenorhabditis nigoni]